jgi:hypothetical protein
MAGQGKKPRKRTAARPEAVVIEIDGRSIEGGARGLEGASRIRITKTREVIEVER